MQKARRPQAAKRRELGKITRQMVRQHTVFVARLCRCALSAERCMREIRHRVKHKGGFCFGAQPPTLRSHLFPRFFSDTPLNGAAVLLITTRLTITRVPIFVHIMKAVVTSLCPQRYRPRQNHEARQKPDPCFLKVHLTSLSRPLCRTLIIGGPGECATQSTFVKTLLPCTLHSLVRVR